MNTVKQVCADVKLELNRWTAVNSHLNSLCVIASSVNDVNMLLFRMEN